ncbi:MAG TPA: Co2+/Mg2+ efflux protein ApaG [Myxococcales bacterium]|jgi:ApaG protein
MASAVTSGIRVTVEAHHLSERREPGRWLFAYQVRIVNEGPAPAQLLSRHWIITDGLGREEHVQGPGVVGQQPVLAPGAAHEYTSFCPLSSPLGSMRGSYQMARSDGTTFEAAIPEFALAAPESLN